MILDIVGRLYVYNQIPTTVYTTSVNNYMNLYYTFERCVGPNYLGPSGFLANNALLHNVKGILYSTWNIKLAFNTKF